MYGSEVFKEEQNAAASMTAGIKLIISKTRVNYQRHLLPAAQTPSLRVNPKQKNEYIFFP